MEQVRLQPLHQRDLETLANYLSYKELPPNGSAVFATIGDQHLWFDHMRSEQASGAAIIRAIVHAEYGIVGTICVHGLHLPGYAQLSYWIAAPYRCRGYATKALDAFLQLRPLSRHKPGVCALVHENNKASLAVLLRCGFVCRGPIETREAEPRPRLLWFDPPVSEPAESRIFDASPVR